MDQWTRSIPTLLLVIRELITGTVIKPAIKTGHNGVWLLTLLYLC